MKKKEEDNTQIVRFCKCLRCGKGWLSRKTFEDPPLACPACGSRIWDRPKKEDVKR